MIVAKVVLNPYVKVALTRVLQDVKRIVRNHVIKLALMPVQMRVLTPVQAQHVPVAHLQKSLFFP